MKRSIKETAWVTDRSLCYCLKRERETDTLSSHETGLVIMIVRNNYVEKIETILFIHTPPYNFNFNGLWGYSVSWWDGNMPANKHSRTFSLLHLYISNWSEVQERFIQGGFHKGTRQCHLKQNPKKIKYKHKSTLKREINQLYLVFLSNIYRFCCILSILLPHCTCIYINIIYLYCIVL